LFLHGYDVEDESDSQRPLKLYAHLTTLNIRDIYQRPL
jgi:hypothetical protein